MARTALSRPIDDERLSARIVAAALAAARGRRSAARSPPACRLSWSPASAAKLRSAAWSSGLVPASSSLRHLNTEPNDRGASRGRPRGICPNSTVLIAPRQYGAQAGELNLRRPARGSIESFKDYRLASALLERSIRRH